MTDTTERDAVRDEFYARCQHGHRILPGLAAVRDAMAEEIVQQRRRAERAERILAALREPSEGVLTAVVGSIAIPGFHLVVQGVLQAAIAAAEREVGRE